MSLLHYIDNEPPSGEWDAIVQGGGSTITRCTDASFPERGSYGMRCDTVAGNVAYARKNIGLAMDPGQWYYLGFWARLLARPTGGTTYAFSTRFTTSTNDFGAMINVNGQIGVFCRDDAGAYPSTGYVYTFTLSRWTYVVMGIKRATTAVAADGEVALYVDGAKVGSATGIDNFDRHATINYAALGCYTNARDDYLVDFDEVKFALDDYPQPYLPTPADEYPSADRTVVLYRTASADSIEFADYCVSQLGVPRGMLCPLPNAGASESLADYPTFQTEVETDLAAWLALNTAAAANVSCFFVGYGVPGYFTSGGVKHSAASRLMNYGTAFSSGTANPLYNPATVSRLTRTALGGKYLACRIDGGSLPIPKAMIDRAATVSGLAELPDSDKLYSDESAYLALVACQKLRILSAVLGAYSDDAFVWGDTGAPAWGAAGTRAAFVNDAADSARTLRVNDNPVCEAVAYAGGGTRYAAGLGCSETPDTFDVESFLEMLRIGGTLAEAVAVAVSKLDYTAVPVGSPLMTVAFQKDGYNVYRGVGDITSVDFDTPVAYLRADDSNPTLAALGHAASTRYTYVVRPVRGANELESPDLSCAVEFVADDAGDWLGNRPAIPFMLEAEVQDSGEVELRWRFATPYGGTAPEDFGIYYGGRADIVHGSPSAKQSYTSDGHYSKTLTLTGGATYYFAVTARTAGDVESPLSDIIGPFVADDTAPGSPALYADGVF